MAPQEKLTGKRAAARERGRLSHRSTSGAGFHFEDMVAGYLLAQSLVGEPVLGLAGSLSTLQFQTHSLGWEIDDLLATAKAGAEIRRTAYSCKSNVQVTRSGFSADFLASVWRQARRGDPFYRETDAIALVTVGHHDQFDAAWAQIKDWSSTGTTDLAAARLMKASGSVKRIFEGIRAAGAEDSALPSVEEAIDLVQHLHMLPLDLGRENSRTAAEGVRLCRLALAADNPAVATELWDELVQRAGRARRTHGTIVVAQLWRELRGNFHFKEHPDHSSSWARIDQLSEDHRAGIETELPGGHRIARPAHTARLASLLQTDGICVVFGESGAGKSALVKATLDREFAADRQVWMGPQTLAHALSEAKRGSLGLDRPLGEILEHSSVASNVLVIDAAERLDATVLPRARDLAERLRASSDSSPPSWRIVIVGQTDSSDGRLQTLSGGAAQRVEVGPLEPAEAAFALRSSPALRHLATDPVVPLLLLNMRTLALVMGASEAFSGVDRPASHVDIADRLFDHWTDNRRQLQGFLIRLSVREAQFQRSFPISEFDQTDLGALDQAPPQFPLIRKHGRIEFQDDLVPDWIRFQRLRELSGNPDEWSKLAHEPLWIPALRLFGQFLLRQGETGSNAWDEAFEATKERGLTSAVDLLLDALCLDPEADSFLKMRADLLFRDEGALLDRLLRQFLHVATVPHVPEILADSSLRFYLEEKLRVPIYGRWPPLLRFFESEGSRLASLGSQTVARLCELWIRTTPVNLGENVPMPFRSSIADLALANAETIWVQRAARHTYGGGDWARAIYSAALSAALDKPEAVATFALQLANRRPWDDRIIERIAGHQVAARQAREAALAADPEKRRREEECSRSQVPHSLMFERDLPPWPLGPTARVDNEFRDRILHGGALTPLMSTQPEIAGEVLLACIIEDSPKESLSGASMDMKLGLEFNSETRTAIYWKSPFFLFLQIAPEEAKSDILRLVEFCTEKWAEEMGREGVPPGLTLLIADDRPQHFLGNWQVFDWPQSSGFGPGQLHSALDALERWLCDRIDAGVDVTGDCLQLLENSGSLSIVGVLTNVGKKRPSLLANVLKPLIAQPCLFWWDDLRLVHEGFRFDVFSWWRAGEVAGKMARDWIFAPHRRTSLKAVVRDLRRADPVLDEELGDLVNAWPDPTVTGPALNQRMLVAELNPANWHWPDDAASPEAQGCTFQTPDDLKQAIQAVQKSDQREPTTSDILAHCRDLLSQQGTLSDEYAAYLFDVLRSNCRPGEEMERAATRTALAATLFVKGWDWLAKNAEARAEVIAAIVGFIEVEERGAPQERDGRMLWAQALAFAGLAAANRLAAGDEDRVLWQRVIRSVVTSGDPGAMGTVIAELRLYRDELPYLWLRTLKLGIFVCALQALKPQYGDEDAIPERLEQWRRRLRQQSIDENGENPNDWDLCGLAERVERIWRSRMVRLRTRDDWRGQLRRRFSNGLNIPSLQALFVWALSEEVVPAANERAEHRIALQKLWEFETWNLCRDNGQEEEEEPDELSQVSELGLSVIRVIASRTAVGPYEECRVLWEPIVGLGARGGFNVEHFIDCYFLRLYKEHDPNSFVESWRAMLAQVFEPTWTSTGRWYRAREIRKHLLGFYAASQLAHSVAVMDQLPSLLEYYRAFAEHDLLHDDSAIEGMSYFLTSAAGRALRLEGIHWLEKAIRGSGRLRQETTTALTEFVDTVLNQHDTQLLAAADTRAALIRLIAQLVEAQAPLALALQERIRSLG